MKIIISRNRTKDSEIKHLFDVYDRIFKNFELASSYYFLRTQIIMFAIQIILGTGFGKLVSDISFPICTQKLVLLLAIPIIGFFFACAWLLFIKRQWNSMEFYRCYMRYIEKKLMNCKAPLALFRAESAIFYWEIFIDFIDSNEVKSFSKDKLQTEFPYFGKRAKSNNLMGTEGTIAYFILLIWIACFVSILCIYWKYWKSLNILPCGIEFVFILAFIIVFIYWKFSKGLWEKSKKERENQKNENYGLLFSIDSKFQNDLNECNPSKKLKDEFNKNKNGIKLSDDYKISIEEKDSKWLIIDKNRKYIIKKEEEKLNVYIYIINFWKLEKDEL